MVSNGQLCIYKDDGHIDGAHVITPNCVIRVHIVWEVHIEGCMLYLNRYQLSNKHITLYIYTNVD